MGNKVARSLIVEFPTTAKRYVVRKIRRFNVIPRSDSKIDKIVAGKQTERAPLYEPTRKIIEKFLEENPDGLTKFSEKDEKLTKTIGDVHVKSTGENKDGFSVARVDTSIMKRLELEYVTEETVPVGKFTFKRAEEFLFAHQKDPKEFSVDTLSKLYSIDEKVMANILDHVKLFKIAFSEKSQVKTPYFAKILQGVAPPEIFEQTTMDRFFTTILPTQKKFAEFHEKLKRPDPEMLPPPTTKMKLIRQFKENLETTADFFDNLAKIAKPENPQSNVRSTDLVETQKSKSKQEMTVATESSEDEKAREREFLRLQKIVRPKDYEFDVFDAVKDGKTELEANKSEKDQSSKKDESLKASEKV